MNVRLLALAGMLTGSAHADCPGAGRLQEALALLNQANPVLIAERARDTEQARQHSWEAAVTVGYSITETFESGVAGPNAQVRLRIPLWDRSAKLHAATDRAATTTRQADAEAALIGDIRALCEQAHQVRALARKRDFTRDRVAYRQERVDQGLDPPDVLWGEAEAMQDASHAWEQAAAELATNRLTLARRWAGTHWARMQALFEAMTQ